ncbi:MAG TPA: CopG family transcriptional regulator [Baekduia sp.]
MGSGPASVESVRLDPELREELAQRAEADGTTPSEVIRQALRSYLHGALSRTPRARRDAARAGRPRHSSRRVPETRLIPAYPG